MALRASKWPSSSPQPSEEGCSRGASSGRKSLSSASRYGRCCGGLSVVCSCAAPGAGHEHLTNCRGEHWWRCGRNDWGCGHVRPLPVPLRSSSSPPRSDGRKVSEQPRPAIRVRRWLRETSASPCDSTAPLKPAGRFHCASAAAESPVVAGVSAHPGLPLALSVLKPNLGVRSQPPRLLSGGPVATLSNSRALWLTGVVGLIRIPFSSRA